MLRPTSRVVALASLRWMRWLRIAQLRTVLSVLFVPFVVSVVFVLFVVSALAPLRWLASLRSHRWLSPLFILPCGSLRAGFAAPPEGKKSRGLSRGNGSAPGRKILAARYSPAGDSRSTLAVEALNFCVRDGNRCDCLAMVTRKRKTEENRSSENADRLAGFAASCGARRSDG